MYQKNSQSPDHVQKNKLQLQSQKTYDQHLSILATPKRTMLRQNSAFISHAKSLNQSEDGVSMGKSRVLPQLTLEQQILKNQFQEMFAKASPQQRGIQTTKNATSFDHIYLPSSNNPNSSRSKFSSAHDSPRTIRILSIDQPQALKKQQQAMTKNSSPLHMSQDSGYSPSQSASYSSSFFPSRSDKTKTKSVILVDQTATSNIPITFFPSNQDVTEPINWLNQTSILQTNQTLLNIERCIEKLETSFTSSPPLQRQHITIKQSKFGSIHVPPSGFNQSTVAMRIQADQLVSRSEECIQMIEIFNSQQTSNSSIEVKSDKAVKQRQIDGYIENTMSQIRKEREMKDQTKNQTGKILEVQSKQIIQLKIQIIQLEGIKKT